MANEQLTKKNRKLWTRKLTIWRAFQPQKEKGKKITEKLAMHKRDYIACDILEILILKKNSPQTCEYFSQGDGR